METVTKKGRPQGSKNKTTAEIRERFSELVENNLSQFQNDLDSLEPAERLKIIMAMAKFILPTLKAIDLNPNNDDVITIDFKEITSITRTIVDG